MHMQIGMKTHRDIVPQAGNMRSDIVSTGWSGQEKSIAPRTAGRRIPGDRALDRDGHGARPVSRDRLHHDDARPESAPDKPR
jgi:hypothetical protein